MKKFITNYKKIKRFNKKMKVPAKSINRFSKSANRFVKKAAKQQRRIDRQNELISQSRSLPIDKMDGLQFEYFLADLHQKLGYEIQLTSGTGDYGADLVIKSNTNEQTVIQAKRYSSRVGVRAVQEISTARSYYNADGAAVVTNNFFTDSAKELASFNNVKLIDRDELMHLISLTKSRVIVKEKGAFERLFNK